MSSSSMRELLRAWLPPPLCSERAVMLCLQGCRFFSFDSHLRQMSNNARGPAQYPRPRRAFGVIFRVQTIVKRNLFLAAQSLRQQQPGDADADDGKRQRIAPDLPADLIGGEACQFAAGVGTDQLVNDGAG